MSIIADGILKVDIKLVLGSQLLLVCHDVCQPFRFDFNVHVNNKLV